MSRSQVKTNPSLTALSVSSQSRNWIARIRTTVRRATRIIHCQTFILSLYHGFCGCQAPPNISFKATIQHTTKADSQITNHTHKASFSYHFSRGFEAATADHATTNIANVIPVMNMFKCDRAWQDRIMWYIKSTPSDPKFPIPNGTYWAYRQPETSAVLKTWGLTIQKIMV